MSTFLTAPSRRKVIKGGLFAVGAAATTNVFSPAIAQTKPDRLVIADGGGAVNAAFKKAYYETFTQKTGIPIVNASYVDIAKLKSMVTSGNVDVDFCDIDAGEGALAAKLGLLEPLDWGLTDRSKIIPGAAHDAWVSNVVAALVVAWNTRELPNGPVPKDWSALLDTSANPGKRAMQKQASQTIEAVLLASGVPGDKLYPLDLDRAFGALDKIKSDLIFWDSGAASAQLLISGEVALSSAWNGRVQKPKDEGAPINLTFNNALLNSGCWIVPKGGKNVKWAQAFFAHVMDPHLQAQASTLINYGPVVSSAYELLPADRLKLIPDPKTGNWQDYDYWAEHADAIIARFNEWTMN